MTKTLSFPSVYEATVQEYYTSNDPILGFSKIKFDGIDYIVGIQALNEGTSPHKTINSSPSGNEYKLIGQSALVLASNIYLENSKSLNFPKISLTVGFPYATFQFNRDAAVEYLKSESTITYYKSDERGNLASEQRLIPIANVNVIPEIMGCDYSIRNGETPIDGNFIIISLGYGTCEGALSTPNGLVNRTIFSTHGLSYAVKIFSQELNKNTFMHLKTEHQIDQIFVKGFTFVDRKLKKLGEEKKMALCLYYKNVISPTISKYISDGDFENSNQIILAGGGAYCTDLIDLFNEEFGNICKISVASQPEFCASVGYAIYSKHSKKNQENEMGSDNFYFADNAVAYVGIDIGNANTCVSVLD